jgi:hypothetical protein
MLSRGRTVRLRTAILTMAVTFVLAVLLVLAYLTSGCHLPDPISAKPAGV